MMNKIKLSDFELEVMTLLWEQQPLSAPQMHELIQNKRAVSYSTVKTIIDRLEAKKAIARQHQIGRTIFYAPIEEQENLSKPIVKGFVNRLFEGKPSNMIAHLIEHEDLNEHDIQVLKDMLDRKNEK